MAGERSQPPSGGSGGGSSGGPPDRPSDELIAEQILTAPERHVGAKLAHDYNNVFQVLSGYLWLIESAQQSDGAPNSYMALMREALDRGNNLTKQQSMLFRAAASTPAGLNDLVRKCEPFWQRMLRTDVTIELDLDPEVDAFLVEQKHARSLLIGTAGYAVGATSGRATLRITSRSTATSDRARVSVVATGAPLPESADTRDHKATLWACHVQAERSHSTLGVNAAAGRVEIELGLPAFKRPG